MRPIEAIDPTHRDKARDFLVFAGVGSSLLLCGVVVLSQMASTLVAPRMGASEVMVVVYVLALALIDCFAGVAFVVWGVVELVSPSKSDARSRRICYKENAKSRLRE